MPALPNRVLAVKLAGALPPSTRFETPEDQVHPAIGVIPRFGRVRLYVWTVTPDRSAQGRPAGEFKIQMILPGQARGKRASLELQDALTALLGYSPEFGVFVAWEAQLHADFAFSRNVQCREELLTEARSTGWAVAEPRHLRTMDRDEVRVSFTPGNLPWFLRTSLNADRERLTGKWREAYFLAQTPNMQGQMPQQRHQLESNIRQQRERLATTRLARDASFSAHVKREYDYACALCGLQLEIIEGAHIIPVKERGSSDAMWNGIALCPNHHALFDASAFVIDPDLGVRIDEDRVRHLNDNGLAEGITALTDFRRGAIRRPNFWDLDVDSRNRMRDALEKRTVGAGLD